MEETSGEVNHCDAKQIITELKGQVVTRLLKALLIET